MWTSGSASIRTTLALLGALIVAFAPAFAIAASYEAELPPQLSSDPNLCAYAPCAQVMPGADNFTPRKGRPSYVEAHAGTGADRRLVGYVFLSPDIVDIPGYYRK